MEYFKVNFIKQHAPEHNLKCQRKGFENIFKLEISIKDFNKFGG